MLRFREIVSLWANKSVIVFPLLLQLRYIVNSLIIMLLSLPQTGYFSLLILADVNLKNSVFSLLNVSSANIPNISFTISISSTSPLGKCDGPDKSIAFNNLLYRLLSRLLYSLLKPNRELFLSNIYLRIIAKSPLRWLANLEAHSRSSLQ